MELELTDQNSELQVQISGKYTWCFHEFLFCYYFSIFPVISRIFFSDYISVMDSVKQNLNVTKEKLDEKEAELEAANTEVAVLKETISALKSGLAIKSDNCAKR